MENQEFDVESEFNKKLKLGKNLLESINNIENRINGLNKLRSKVKQEISFLENRKTSQSLKKEHLVCSNLIHYEALVSKLLRTENPISVLEVCHYKNESDQRKIIIDIVSHKKTRWCKVIARNPKALFHKFLKVKENTNRNQC
ncbi:hypothetical protein O3M35_007072 [Rhynocoris fuscipes]|uniref:DUF5614 domain-containing protein n=1 Tax=Rhynocoris fuscipes TaxID=488301 RepID=A0AAW1DBM7_9HEMI